MHHDHKWYMVVWIPVAKRRSSAWGRPVTGEREGSQENIRTTSSWSNQIENYLLPPHPVAVMLACASTDEG
jgi:hypothetical protein